MPLNKMICSNMNHRRLYKLSYSLMKFYSSDAKLTIKLAPEIENSLDSGDMKHRKHPGVRKHTCVYLPPELVSAVDRIIANQSESSLREKAKSFNNYLHSRRPPMEFEELHRKIETMDPVMNDQVDEMSETMQMKLTEAIGKKLKSELYRWKALEYDETQCILYLVGRLAENYASVIKVLGEIQWNMPSFKPKSFFDFGSGVGSATWAAHSIFKDSIKEYFCVDASPDMNNLALDLMTDPDTETTYLKNVFFRQFLPSSEKIKYDLVVSAFSLLDQPSLKEKLRVIDILWRKTQDTLVFIEHGNSTGFAAILDARDYILKMENELSQEFALESTGAHVISPCPHVSECPLLKEDPKSPCGTTILYQPLFPRKLDMKKFWFSYVVLRRGPPPKDCLSWPRIVKPIVKSSGHIHCHLCCPSGKLEKFVVSRSKHGRNTYRCARSSNVGDLLPVTFSPMDAKKTVK